MRWRVIDRPDLKAQFQCEPRGGLWLGIIWLRTEVARHIMMVCVFPFVTFHVVIAAWGQQEPDR